MDKAAYEARKAGIKRMRARASEDLDRIRRTPNRPRHDPDYQRAVERYRAIQQVLREFIRKNSLTPGGSFIFRSHS